VNSPVPLDDPNLAMVEIVVDALGDVANDVVLVGGCATGLLVTGPRSQRIRATLAVDLVAEVTSIHDYHEIERRLLLRRFRHDTSPDAPICRWVGFGVTIDVMPSQAGVLAFHNRWYPMAVASARLLRLPSERAIRLVTAPVFVATKIEAFRDRGRGDYLVSHDLEDIITVVDGRGTMIHELAESEPELRTFVSAAFSTLLQRQNFLDALPGHLPGDAASQARVPVILERMQAISELSSGPGSP
jgi:predicted nucleotidyltransferase